MCMRDRVSITMASVCRELRSNTGAYPEAAPEAVPEEATWTDPALSGGGAKHPGFIESSDRTMIPGFLWLGSPVR